MKQLRLTSYGFIRDERNDFINSGNNFKAYTYKNIEFLYLRKYNSIFLLGRIEQNQVKENINVGLKELGCKINSILNRYNGVSNYIVDDETMKSYVKDLDECINLINDYRKLEESINSITVYSFNGAYMTNMVVDKNMYVGQYEYVLKMTIIEDWQLEGFKRNMNVEIKELIVK